MRHLVSALAALLAVSSLTLATTASAQDDTSDDEVVCSYDAYNCGDFSSCAQVMQVFRACEGDVHKLDRDKDGVPCESLCD
ncbi:nuclease [Persicimonas caeni]|uniref:Nuclease n=1 Tax=Persicimonas caeni TaxID=2292766 RepID=A0A4Y6PVW9_PERCE|nr:excalibur calcium-binding domain-containing protein [Persicimonas caeni]QDG52147.1 nuclease [Persicimonas caeni]QED33369.1 nuclease [Persicimonas caeni]